MSDLAAGPSKSATKVRKQKRKNDSATSTPAKTPRVISPERDEVVEAPIASSSKNGADPMEALENEDDPMERLAGEKTEAESSVVPTRADEFEQEAEREVEAAKGLDGAAEEGKMKLVHQVRHQVREMHRVPEQSNARLRSLLDSHTSQSPSTSEMTRRQGSTSLPSILSSSSRHLVSSETKVYWCPLIPQRERRSLRSLLLLLA